MTDGSPRLRWFTATDVGLVRKQNEDFVQAVPESGDKAAAEPPAGRLCIVADGMGGHYGGAVASRIAAQRTVHHYYGAAALPLRERLLQAIAAAGRDIADAAAEDRKLARMGTTVVAAAVEGEHAVIANIGDSRAYLYRNGMLEQLSTDDRWVTEQVRDGLLSAETAAHHPQRNVLTQYLGARDDASAHVRDVLLRAGDRLLLCSDGLHELVSDREITTALQQDAPARAVQRLLKLALQRGAGDNVTIAVGAYDPVVQRRMFVPRPVPIAVGLAAALLLGMQVGALLRPAAPETSLAVPQRTSVQAPLPTRTRATVTPNPTVEAQRREQTAAALGQLLPTATDVPTAADATTEATITPADSRTDVPAVSTETATSVPTTTPVPVAPRLQIEEIVEVSVLTPDERAVYPNCLEHSDSVALLLSSLTPYPLPLRFTFVNSEQKGYADLPAGLTVRQPSGFECYPTSTTGIVAVSVTGPNGELARAEEIEFVSGRRYLVRFIP